MEDENIDITKASTDEAPITEEVVQEVPSGEENAMEGPAKKRKRRSFHFPRILSRLDRYLIGKFLGTYFFSIILIISIAVVFDYNENIDKFTTNHAPWHDIIYVYYLNFVPYYANLFSALFIFIAVIFFTTKLAGNSEIIAMLSTGMSYHRLMWPYFLSALFLFLMTFWLGGF